MLGEGAPFVESQQEEKTASQGKAEHWGWGMGAGEHGWRVEFGQSMPGSGNPGINQMWSSPPQTPPSYGRGRAINRPIGSSVAGVELEVSSGVVGAQGESNSLCLGLVGRINST